MKISTFTQPLGKLITAIRRPRERSRGVRFALVGLVVLIPTAAIAGLPGTYSIENVFWGGHTYDPYWTPYFSEEDPGWTTVRGVVIGAGAVDSYSDKLSLHGHPLAPGYSIGREESAEIVVSDEDGHLGLRCPRDMWITSVRASGRFSDNVHFKCRSVYKGTTRLKWGPISVREESFSEEVTRSTGSCPGLMAATGWACLGSYCDDNVLLCDTFSP